MACVSIIQIFFPLGNFFFLIWRLVEGWVGEGRRKGWSPRRGSGEAPCFDCVIRINYFYWRSRGRFRLTPTIFLLFFQVLEIVFPLFIPPPFQRRGGDISSTSINKPCSSCWFSWTSCSLTSGCYCSGFCCCCFPCCCLRGPNFRCCCLCCSCFCFCCYCFGPFCCYFCC